jgi:hypothetical protein
MHMQDLVPPTAIKVFKTSAWPQPADCMGQASPKGCLGRKFHVAQLNAAGKHVASILGWEVRTIPACQPLFIHASGNDKAGHMRQLRPDTWQAHGIYAEVCVGPVNSLAYHQKQE